MTRATERPSEPATRSNMKAGVAAPGRASIPARTLRTDNWKKAPVVTFALLTTWVLYAAVRTVWHWDTAYFAVKEHYLSPFYSPCIATNCTPHAQRLRHRFAHFPQFIPYAVLTLPFLLGFRLTCYYYRRSYYRAFWASPPACGVAEPHAKYTGETSFPLILQNLHRYFWVAAGLISIVNTWDVVQAFRPIDCTVTRASGSASGTFDPAGSTSSCCGPTRCRATPAGTSSAASCATSPGTRCATGRGASSPSSTPSTCSWPGRRWPP